MIGDSIEEAKARISTLVSVRDFVSMLIKERRRELKEARERKRRVAGSLPKKGLCSIGG